MEPAKLEEHETKRESERVAAAIAEVVLARNEVVRAFQPAVMMGVGPTKAQLRAAQEAAYRHLEIYVQRGRDLIFGDEGIIRSTRRDEMPVWLSKCLVSPVLKQVHESRRLSGYYKLQKTMTTRLGKYGWKGLAKYVAAYIKSVSCALYLKMGNQESKQKW